MAVQKSTAESLSQSDEMEEKGCIGFTPLPDADRDRGSRDSGELGAVSTFLLNEAEQDCAHRKNSVETSASESWTGACANGNVGGESCQRSGESPCVTVRTRQEATSGDTSGDTESNVWTTNNTTCDAATAFDAASGASCRRPFAACERGGVSASAANFDVDRNADGAGKLLPGSSNARVAAMTVGSSGGVLASTGVTSQNLCANVSTSVSLFTPTTTSTVTTVAGSAEASGTYTWASSDSSPSPSEGADSCGLGLLNDTLNTTVDLIKFGAGIVSSYLQWRRDGGRYSFSTPSFGNAVQSRSRKNSCGCVQSDVTRPRGRNASFRVRHSDGGDSRQVTASAVRQSVSEDSSLMSIHRNTNNSKRTVSSQQSPSEQMTVAGRDMSSVGDRTLTVSSTTGDLASSAADRLVSSTTDGLSSSAVNGLGSSASNSTAVNAANHCSSVETAHHNGRCRQNSGTHSQLYFHCQSVNQENPSCTCPEHYGTVCSNCKVTAAASSLRSLHTETCSRRTESSVQWLSNGDADISSNTHRQSPVSVQDISHAPHPDFGTLNILSSVPRVVCEHSSMYHYVSSLSDSFSDTDSFEVISDSNVDAGATTSGSTGELTGHDNTAYTVYIPPSALFQDDFSTAAYPNCSEKSCNGCSCGGDAHGSFMRSRSEGVWWQGRQSYDDTLDSDVEVIACTCRSCNEDPTQPSGLSVGGGRQGRRATARTGDISSGESDNVNDGNTPSTRSGSASKLRKSPRARRNRSLSGLHSSKSPSSGSSPCTSASSATASPRFNAQLFVQQVKKRLRSLGSSEDPAPSVQDSSVCGGGCSSHVGLSHETSACTASVPPTTRRDQDSLTCTSSFPAQMKSNPESSACASVGLSHAGLNPDSSASNGGFPHQASSKPETCVAAQRSAKGLGDGSPCSAGKCGCTNEESCNTQKYLDSVSNSSPLLSQKQGVSRQECRPVVEAVTGGSPLTAGDSGDYERRGCSCQVHGRQRGNSAFNATSRSSSVSPEMACFVSGIRNPACSTRQRGKEAATHALEDIEQRTGGCSNSAHTSHQGLENFGKSDINRPAAEQSSTLAENPSACCDEADWLVHPVGPGSEGGCQGENSAGLSPAFPLTLKLLHPPEFSVFAGQCGKVSPLKSDVGSATAVSVGSLPVSPPKASCLSVSTVSKSAALTTNCSISSAVVPSLMVPGPQDPALSHAESGSNSATHSAESTSNCAHSGARPKHGRDMQQEFAQGVVSSVHGDETETDGKLLKCPLHETLSLQPHCSVKRQSHEEDSSLKWECLREMGTEKRNFEPPANKTYRNISPKLQELTAGNSHSVPCQAAPTSGNRIFSSPVGKRLNDCERLTDLYRELFQGEVDINSDEELDFLAAVCDVKISDDGDSSDDSDETDISEENSSCCLSVDDVESSGGSSLLDHRNLSHRNLSSCEGGDDRTQFTVDDVDSFHGNPPVSAAFNPVDLEFVDSPLYVSVENVLPCARGGTVCDCACSDSVSNSRRDVSSENDPGFTTAGGASDMQPFCGCADARTVDLDLEPDSCTLSHSQPLSLAISESAIGHANTLTPIEHILSSNHDNRSSTSSGEESISDENYEGDGEYECECQGCQAIARQAGLPLSLQLFSDPDSGIDDVLRHVRQPRASRERGTGENMVESAHTGERGQLELAGTESLPGESLDTEEMLSTAGAVGGMDGQIQGASAADYEPDDLTEEDSTFSFGSLLQSQPLLELLENLPRDELAGFPSQSYLEWIQATLQQLGATLEGTAARLTEADIQALPSFPAAKSEVDEMCPICLVNFQGGEILIRLPGCTHVFHAQCIRKWLNVASSCPVCRRSVHRHVLPP